MRIVFLIGAGSFIGGISRYLLSQLIDEKWGNSFTLGTLAVNVLGCFLIGVVFSLSDRALLGQEGRFFLATGLLGGFTTFSAFSYQTIYLLQNGKLTYAALYVTSSILLGLFATYLGLYLFKTS